MKYIQIPSGVVLHSGVKDMRWGVRRYRNYDGTLTEEGKKRYAKEVKKNAQKPKDKRADPDALNDPAKWVKDDLETRKKITESSKSLVEDVKTLERLTRKNKKNPRLDLSDKSDKELRDKLNREILERQYNDVFNAPKTSKGRKIVETILEGATAGLGLTTAAISVALGIHTLKHG